MRNLARGLVIAGLILVSAFAQPLGVEFRQGWSDGWCEAYREIQEDPWAICPIEPLPPIPPIGRDNYKGGFALGYTAAYEEYN